jgi:hypothetical protein
MAGNSAWQGGAATFYGRAVPHRACCSAAVATQAAVECPRAPVPAIGAPVAHPRAVAVAVSVPVESGPEVMMVMAVPMSVVEMAPVMVVPEVAMAPVPMAMVASAATDLLDKRSCVGGLRALGTGQGSRGGCPGGERRSGYDRGAHGERFDAHVSSSSVYPGDVRYVIQCRKMWHGSVATTSGFGRAVIACGEGSVRFRRAPGLRGARLRVRTRF